LNFSKDGIDTKSQQIESFKYILGLLAEKKKILSLHSRRAGKEIFELLKEFNIKNAIFHWYYGSIKVLNEIVERGYYFSINTSMITSTNGRGIISEIPKNKFLTEKDSPYVQYMGAPSKPENVNAVLIYLAKHYNKPLSIIENLVNKNFSELINKIK